MKSALDLMEMLEPSYIEEADDMPAKKSRRPIVYAAAMAACFCIIAAAAIPAMRNNTPTEPVQPSEAPIEAVTPSDTPTEIALPSPSPEKTEPKYEPYCDPSLFSFDNMEKTEHIVLDDVYPESVGGCSLYGGYALDFEDYKSNIRSVRIESGDTLPVYMTKFDHIAISTHEREITAEERETLKHEAETLAALAGYEGKPLSFDRKALVEDYPRASCMAGDTRIVSYIDRINISVNADITQPDFLENVMETNPYIRTAMELWGVKDCYIFRQNDYPFFYYDFEELKSHWDVEENYADRTIYISEDSEDDEEFLRNSVFTSVRVWYTEYPYKDLALVYFSFPKSSSYWFVDEYEAVTYDEALETFCAETGKSESDVVGWEITYDNFEKESMLVPAYIFYYVEDEYPGASGVIIAGTAVLAVKDR